jgi:hypothetical protein
MAMATGNYHQFFALYLVAPNMGGYIMDHYVDRERCEALITMTKAYVSVVTASSSLTCKHPISYRAIPLRHLLTELGYERDELPKLLLFLSQHSANVYTNPNAMDADKQLAANVVHQTLLQVKTQKYAKVGIRGSI